eukprot:XP_001706037.1 Hypothetical protein GL50803_4978 [Giardia lamblia ATCC 50803]
MGLHMEMKKARAEVGVEAEAGAEVGVKDRPLTQTEEIHLEPRYSKVIMELLMATIQSL